MSTEALTHSIISVADQRTHRSDRRKSMGQTRAVWDEDAEWRSSSMAPAPACYPHA
jgi:hypothetical protein